MKYFTISHIPSKIDDYKLLIETKVILIYFFQILKNDTINYVNVFDVFASKQVSLATNSQS